MIWGLKFHIASGLKGVPNLAALRDAVFSYSRKKIGWEMACRQPSPRQCEGNGTFIPLSYFTSENMRAYLQSACVPKLEPCHRANIKHVLPLLETVHALHLQAH